jgi:hypothetical protein
VDQKKTHEDFLIIHFCNLFWLWQKCDIFVQGIKKWTPLKHLKIYIFEKYYMNFEKLMSNRTKLNFFHKFPSKNQYTSMPSWKWFGNSYFELLKKCKENFDIWIQCMGSCKVQCGH